MHSESRQESQIAPEIGHSYAQPCYKFLNSCEEAIAFRFAAGLPALLSKISLDKERSRGELMSNEDDRVEHGEPERQPIAWQPFVYLNRSPHRETPANSKPSALDATNSSQEWPAFALANAKVGDRVRIVALNCGESNPHLAGMGLVRGVVLEIASRTATGSVIVALPDQRLGLGAEIARQIQVIDAAEPFDLAPHHSTNRKAAAMETVTQRSEVKLRTAAIGSTLKVTGYEPTARDYKRKLLAMGLTPGTELVVKRHAPLGDPTEIEVRGFRLSLRKTESDALIVEPI